MSSEQDRQLEADLTQRVEAIAQKTDDYSYAMRKAIKILRTIDENEVSGTALITISCAIQALEMTLDADGTD